MNDCRSWDILDRMLEPLTGLLSGGAAESIANLRADPELQSRIDDLAGKAAEGDLRPEEHEEYAAYVEAIDLIGVLQAKARKALSRQNAA